MLSERQQASSQRRDFLMHLLSDAYHQAHGSESGADLRCANDMLQAVLEKMKDKTERMLREDHEECWQRWLEVKETAKWKRKEICDFNYGKFKNEAYTARGWAESLPKDARTKVQEVQRELKGRTMEKWQFDEINEVLDDAWKIASGVLQSRHQEWEQRQREAKSRKLEARQRKEEQLRNRYYQVDKCNDMLRNARSREREYLIEGWISEHQSKIRELEDAIRDIDNAIRDIDSKL